MIRTALLLVPFVLLFAAANAQSVLHVPSAHPTIQSAIDSAQAGDTVVVAAGHYTEQLVIDKPLTVTAADGPEATHVIGGQPGPVVMLGTTAFVPGGGVNLVSPIRLEGFTIRDGIATGVLTAQADARIVDCIIRDNRGVDAPNTPSPIRNTPGGVEVMLGSFVTFEHCSIVGNTGGKGRDSITALLFYCTNGEPGNVGGLRTDQYNCVVTLRDCLVADNVGGAGGDAMSFSCSQPQTDPHAPGVPHLPGSGGVGALVAEAGYAFPTGAPLESPIHLVRTTVTGNVGGPGGGGYISGAQGFGGFVSTPSSTVTDSIVWNNGVTSFAGTPPVVNFSDVEGGASGVGNIDADPLFADPSNGDYHLSSGSPCIDAADPAATALPVEDHDGHPRLVGARLDMGHDEFAPLYAGTMDDFVLFTTLDGDGESLHLKPALGGESFVLTITSPQGSLTGVLPILVLQAFPNGTVIRSPYAGLQFDPNDIAVVLDGTSPVTPLPAAGLTFGPTTLSTGLLNGFTIRFQALGLGSSPQNGIYAASDADDILFH